MEFSKHFFKFLLLLLLFIGAINIVNAADIDDCLQKGKMFFDVQQFEQAQQQFSACVTTHPNAPEGYLSLAGTLLKLNKFSEAEKQFQNALAKTGDDSPSQSYAYSMLGDIALKQQKNAQALELYKKSLSFHKANINSLIGQGVILEYTGDKKGAAESYEQALSFEPTNLVARKRLINLEPSYFSDEQILTALQQRYAPTSETSKVTEQERDLFFHIHQAEQRRGTDYLKNKIQPLPPDYIVTLYKDTPIEREILTYSGYQTLQKHLGQDALSAFQKAGISAKDVFTLRDLKGKPIFDKNGYLTDEGFYAYTGSLTGKKSFLLPNEDVPPTPEDLQRADRAAQHLKDQGYIEISRNEYNMLLKVTKCSAETLKNDLDVRSVAITKHRLRHFVQSKELPHKQALKAVPYYYVMTERAKKNPQIKVPKNSVIEYHKYFGHAEICLDDGKPLLQNN